MAISIDNLTPQDYKIIAYVNKNGEVSKEQIVKRLSKTESVGLRVEYLSSRPSDSMFIEEKYETTLDTLARPHYTYKGVYSITPLGKKVLQDFKDVERIQRRNAFFSGVLLPITVTLLTMLITSVLKWLLVLM